MRYSGWPPASLPSARIYRRAHLIHRSSEGRFTITYAPGKGVSRQGIEAVGYRWADLETAAARYLPKSAESRLAGFYHTTDGEQYFFVPNPALGLWSTAARFG